MLSTADFLLREDSPEYFASGRDKNPPCPFLEMDGEEKKEYWATLALRHCAGLGARRQAILLKCFGTAREAIERRREWKDAGISKALAREFASGNWREAAKREMDKSARLNDVILLWRNAFYPSRLREISDPPILLYCRGNLELLNSPAIATVGSRKASARGVEMARGIARALSASGIAIVSGMASGIDGAAHTGALENLGKSIGVLGTGIDMVYPPANRPLFAAMRAEGLLLSEFEPGSRPQPRNFPIRNRIISGISLGLVVVEAALASGSLVTARLALEQNRDVFAVPGPAMTNISLGCQNLLRQGATPVFGVEDILLKLAEELKNYKIKAPDIFLSTSQAPQTASQPPDRDEQRPQWQNLCATPRETRKQTPPGDKITDKLLPADKTEQISAFLREHGPIQVDALSDSLAIPIGELNTILVALEIRGKVRRLPGARFEAENE